MFQTYQTKIKNEMFVLPNKTQMNLYDYFHHFASDFGKIERKLFVDLYVRKLPNNDLKVFYCSRYNLTSRQYNGIKNQLDGRVKSKMELSKLYIEETISKIKRTKTLILEKVNQKEKQHIVLLKMKGNEPTFFKKVKKYRSLRHYIHQKKRKLHRLELKLKRLLNDKKENKIRLCFGSKELFHKQFHLEENNLTFSEWKQKWKETRASQFTFIGSKDETFGNQSCTYDLNKNLRLRVNTNDEKIYGKYMTIPNVLFSYGQEHLDKAKIPSIGYTKGKGSKVKYYRALTFKFIRKNDIWYVNATVDVDLPNIQTVKGNGVIGVDFNQNFLAVTEVDRFGNYLHGFHVPFQVHHASSEQAKQSLSEALKIAVEYAKEKQKPIANEKLDFKKKKQTLKETNKKQAHMLSGFAYSTYQTLLKSKCDKAGIQLINVNPAYTSQIGHHKFMKKYGISSHSSAAMVIARRSLRFKKIEKIPIHHLLKPNKEKVLSKNRIHQWKELSKQWKSYSFNQKNYLLYKID